MIQVAAWVCTLLVASGTLEWHNLANHHRAIEVGPFVAEAATHPRIPHHFDRSDELREPGCATCALQAHARGLRSSPTEPFAPAMHQYFELPATTAPALAPPASSASPRGPPAA